MKTIGYAAHSTDANMVPYHFERRDLRSNDVAIEILYSGICHSDLHTVNGDWGPQAYPLVPGHEIVGRVIEVGSDVKAYQVGDHVAVGCMVDSCQECDQCHNHEEQFCRNGMTPTYGAPDRISGEITQGGYSKHIVVREEFVLSVPEKLDLSRAAPILCAGITTYSPLRSWNIGKGSRVGVIGLGGLGHMAVKLAVAMGAEVTVISRSDDKEDEAKAIGAKGILVSKDEGAMNAAAASFDFILDTVPVKHDVSVYTPLLDIDGSLVIVGQVGPMDEFATIPLIFGRRRVAGSLIGGIKETQEVLDFCAEHNIHPECKMIRPDEVNDAFSHLKKGDVAHRFVIDMSQLDEAAQKENTSQNIINTMLSYQHIYHAGNLADIHKHAILCYMLSYMVQKDKPLSYIETHGGRALYDLKSKEALKTGEAGAGVERLLQDGKIFTGTPTPFSEALKALQSQYGRNTYPGSPLFAAHILREQDTAHIAELHPQEIIHLQNTFQNYPKKIHVQHAEGLKMASGLAPPTPRRGLLMIDPSYEIKEEYRNIVSFITKIHKKWPIGVIALWYPILPSGHHIPMIRSLKELNTDALCHEVSFEAVKGHRLQGSGMFVINPPYKTDEHAQMIEKLFF